MNQIDIFFNWLEPRVVEYKFFFIIIAASLIPFTAFLKRFLQLTEDSSFKKRIKDLTTLSKNATKENTFEFYLEKYSKSSSNVRFMLYTLLVVTIVTGIFVTHAVLTSWAELRYSASRSACSCLEEYSKKDSPLIEDKIKTKGCEKAFIYMSGFNLPILRQEKTKDGRKIIVIVSQLPNGTFLKIENVPLVDENNQVSQRVKDLSSAFSEKAKFFEAKRNENLTYNVPIFGTQADANYSTVFTGVTFLIILNFLLTFLKRDNDYENLTRSKMFFGCNFSNPKDFEAFLQRFKDKIFYDPSIASSSDRLAKLESIYKKHDPIETYLREPLQELSIESPCVNTDSAPWIVAKVLKQELLIDYNYVLSSERAESSYFRRLYIPLGILVPAVLFTVLFLTDLETSRIIDLLVRKFPAEEFSVLIFILFFFIQLILVRYIIKAMCHCLIAFFTLVDSLNNPFIRFHEIISTFLLAPKFKDNSKTELNDKKRKGYVIFLYLSLLMLVVLHFASVFWLRGMNKETYVFSLIFSFYFLFRVRDFKTIRKIKDQLFIHYAKFSFIQILVLIIFLLVFIFSCFKFPFYSLNKFEISLIVLLVSSFFTAALFPSLKVKYLEVGGRMISILVFISLLFILRRLGGEEFSSQFSYLFYYLCVNFSILLLFFYVIYIECFPGLIKRHGQINEA